MDSFPVPQLSVCATAISGPCSKLYCVNMEYNSFVQGSQRSCYQIGLETIPNSDTTSSEPVSSCQTPSSQDEHISLDSTDGNGRNHKKKFERKGTTSFAYRIREHVRLGPKFSETVKGKLSIIKKGGREKIFKDMFGLNDGEKLLKASQCYLSTTAGPIAGNLFISTQKVCFCSERCISVDTTSSSGIITIPYKLSIPLNKIKDAYESDNVNNPSQKYIEIVTQDEFEFWFMGFVRYEKALINLQKAISMSR